MFMDGSGLDSELPTDVLCPISEEVEGVRRTKKDSGNEMILVALRSPVRRYWRVRKAGMEEMMNHHVFDEVPESDAATKKLIRERWLNDDRGEKARECLVAMEIAHVRWGLQAGACGSVAASFVRNETGELAVAENQSIAP